jgi:hypothetical protein
MESNMDTSQNHEDNGDPKIGIGLVSSPGFNPDVYLRPVTPSTDSSEWSPGRMRRYPAMPRIPSTEYITPADPLDTLQPPISSLVLPDPCNVGAKHAERCRQPSIPEMLLPDPCGAGTGHAGRVRRHARWYITDPSSSQVSSAASSSSAPKRAGIDQNGGKEEVQDTTNSLLVSDGIWLYRSRDSYFEPMSDAEKEGETGRPAWVPGGSIDATHGPWENLEIYNGFPKRLWREISLKPNPGFRFPQDLSPPQNDPENAPFDNTHSEDTQFKDAEVNDPLYNARGPLKDPTHHSEPSSGSSSGWLRFHVGLKRDSEDGLNLNVEFDPVSGYLGEFTPGIVSVSFTASSTVGSTEGAESYTVEYEVDLPRPSTPSIP